MIYTRRFQLGILAIAVILANLICRELLAQLDQPPQTDLWRARRVVNGQVLELQLANDPNSKVERVALAGVNSPLADQKPWGDLAKQYLADLVKDKQLRVKFEPNAQDLSGRPLVLVWADDLLVNRALIAEGIVLAQALQPSSSWQAEFDAAQTRARILGLGIWDLAQPLRRMPRGR
ncbi:MAG: thermonuclease family protein [Pseudanabaenaceae cyanobacterium bins.68]|nr:thermonuclease family protein [Pseudanabaenaceae cyanobacterium bins.68]